MRNLLFIFLMLNVSLTFSQTVYMKVNKHDGTSELYPIQDIRKITFSGLTVITSTEQLASVVNTFNMLKSYPNPFNSKITIEYELPSNGNIEINILDINGRIIQSIPNEYQNSGKHNYVWDGISNTGIKAPCGIYFCNVKFEDKVLNSKMILIK